MRQTSVAAQTTSERLATVLSYGALLLLGYLVYRIFLPFFVPLAWSAVLAIFFFPMYERLCARRSLAAPRWSARWRLPSCSSSRRC